MSDYIARRPLILEPDYSNLGMGYRKSSMATVAPRNDHAWVTSPAQTRSDLASAVSAATTLIERGVCVWCEAAPSTPTSYLCRDCAAQDPEGVLSRMAPVVSPRDDETVH